METFDFFHGGAVWHHTEAKILKPKKNKCEAGIGIYLTTNYHTAKKYGRSVSIITIKKPILSHNVLIPCQDFKDFVNSYIGPKNKSILLQHTQDKEKIPAINIVNLFVNLDITGKQGLAMNDFLINHKIQASIHNHNYDDQWIVVHDPTIITKTQHVTSKNLTNYQFPKL